MKERDVQHWLQTKLGGEIEVSCPVGRIDLETANHVVEVKKYRNWKSGLGQAVAYASYRPGKIPVLCLFNQSLPPLRDRITITNVCRYCEVWFVFNVDDEMTLELPGDPFTIPPPPVRYMNQYHHEEGILTHLTKLEVLLPKKNASCRAREQKE